MWESLVERLLAAKLGKYIAGLQRDNLSVAFWRGEIALENASIRPEALSRLQLPLRLKLGQIQTLKVRIPWRKLASQSVEIELKGLYLILVPVDSQDWTYDKPAFVRMVKERLEMHEIRREQSQNQKLLSAEENLRNKSFLQRLTAKIVDNLRITIRDIHVRFEFHSGLHAFSSGLMLSKVDYFTTDPTWRRQFTDRQQKGQAGQDIYKYLTCERLAVYFETDESTLYHLHSDPKVALDSMHHRILHPEGLHFILDPMNLQAKVTHNSDLTDFTRPRYRAEVELQELQLCYDQRQLHCSARVADFVTDYWQFLRLEEEKKKYKAFLPVKRTPKRMWKFAVLCIIKRIRQKKDPKKDQFLVPEWRLRVWERDFVSAYRLESASSEEIARFEEVLDLCPFDQLCEWASMVLQRQDSLETLTEHHAPIDYSDLVHDIGSEVLLVPADFKWLTVNYHLHTCLFRLKKTKKETGNCEEGLDLRFFEFHSKLSLFTNAFHLKLTLEDCEFCTWESHNSPFTFCYKVNPADTLLSLHFQLHPRDVPAVTLTSLIINSPEIRYSPLVLSLVINFFAVPEGEKVGKSENWEEIQKQEKEKSVFFASEEHCFRLTFNFVSFLLTLDSKNHILKAKSDQISLQNDQFDITNDKYERFLLNFTNFSVNYSHENSQIPLISPANLSFHLHHLHKSFQTESKSPEFLLNLTSKSLNIQSNYAIYQKLLKIKEFLRVNEEAWESISMHKKAIMRKADLFDLIFTEEKSTIFAVLAEKYVYFFTNPQTVFANNYFYLKNCEMERNELEIVLKNEFTRQILVFESEKMAEKWGNLLENRIKEVKKEEKIDTLSVISTKSRNFELNFDIENIKIGLLASKNLEFSRFELESVLLQLNHSDFHTISTISTSKFQLFDLLNPGKFPLILTETSQNRVQITINQANLSPLYLHFGFNSLLLNWSLSNLSSLFHFFDPIASTEISEKKLFEVNLTAEKVQLGLICGGNDVCLMRGEIYTPELVFGVKQEGMSFTGKFSYVHLMDATDYPHTANYVFSPARSPSISDTYTGREVLLETSTSLHSFSLIIPDIISPKHTENPGNSFTMTLHGAKVFYMHQPICRLVEFFNTRLVGLFEPGLRLKAMQNTEKMHDFSYEFSLPESYEFEQIRKITKLKIKLPGMKLVVLPRLNHPDSLQISLSSVLISNTMSTSLTRHPVQTLYTDIVKFELKSMDITCNEFNLTHKNDLIVNLERLLATEKVSQIEGVERHFQLDIHSEVMDVALEQAHFNLIMKLFDLNFTYDDHMETTFFPDNAIIAGDPKDESHQGLFMQVTVDFRRMELSLLKEKGRLADIDFGSFLLRIWKYSDGYMELDLNSQLFTILTPKTLTLLRSHSAHSKADTPVLHKGHTRVMSFTKSTMEVLCRPLEPSNRELDGKILPTLKLTMKKQTNGNKEIVMNLIPLRISFNLADFFQIQYFFYYGLPNYEHDRETPFDYLRHPHSRLISPYTPPKIHVNVYFERSFLIFPSNNPDENLISEGEFLFTYFRDEIQAEDYPAVSKKLECCQIETFICSKSDLESSESGQFLTKRKIMDAVDASYETILMGRGGKRMGSCVNYTVSMMQLLTTFSDLQLIKETMEFQQGKLRDESGSLTDLLEFTPLSIPSQSPELRKRRISREISGEEPLFRTGRSLTLTPRLTKSQSFADENDFKRKFTCDGVSLVTLNDRVAAFTPVFDLAISKFTITSDVKKTSSMEHSELTLRLLVYNPVNDSWEPLVEPFSLILQRIWSEAELPETQWLVSVSNDATLDISLAEDTINRLYLALKDYNRPKHASLISKSDCISPFTVTNHTSLTVVLEQWTQGKSRYSYKREETMELAPGSSQPFQLELQFGRLVTVEIDNLHFVLKDKDVVATEFSGVNLKRVHTEAREFQLKGRTCSVIVDVVMESSGKKVILRSPVVFQNDTEVDFWLLFEEQEVCSAGSEVQVPVHMCRAMVSLLPNVPAAETWVSIDLHDVAEPVEISAGDAHFLLVPKTDLSSLRTVIHITAPVIVRSAVPLPMKITLTSPHSDVQISHFLSKGELCKIHGFSSYEDIYLTLSFQSYMTSKATLIASRRLETAKSIEMLDVSGEDLNMYIYYKKQGNVVVTVCPAMVIINSTALPLIFYYKKTGTVRRIPGQLNPAIVISDMCRKLCVGLDRCRSRPFKTGAAGAINVITVDTEEDSLGDSIRYQFVYNVEVAWLFPGEVIYTRVVTVTPRFILVNGLQEELLVRQMDTQECCLSIRPGDQLPFYWPNGHLRQLVQLKSGRYSWSGALVISTIGVTSFCCLPLEPDLPLLHLRAEVKFTDLSVLVTIEEENDKYCTYRVENFSTRVSFCIYQECSPEAFQWLDICSNTVFSWKEPALDHKIVAEMFLGSLTHLPVKSGSAYWFCPDNINDMSKIKIELTDELGQYITARTLNIGTCKVLRFYDSILRPDDTKEAERAATQVTLTIPRFGLSIIETVPSTSEILYISFTRLELRATRSVISQQIELIIDRVQIDNQYSLRACFPVLLAPKMIANHGKPTVICKFDYHLDQNPNSFHVQVAEIELQPLIIQIESGLMLRLMSLFQRVAPAAVKSEVFKQISTSSGIHSHTILKGLMIPQAEKSFYLSQLRLHTIEIVLSFLPVKDMDEQDNDTFMAFIHAVGMVVSTIDSAPISFEAVEKNDLVGMQKQITTALWMSYRSQLAAQLLSLIGHANVLGNPVGLLDGLGRGVADFFSAPAQGMRTGAVGAGIGLIKGAESLLKNTVSATFGSVSKLASTMATGLSALTQDKYFLSERQRESVTSRPSNVVEGVEMGVKSLFRSFGKGISGVVTEPIKGVRRDGFTGLLSGSLKGIGGFLAQPVAGVFDMTSRTAEGIMNTAGENVMNLRRVRDPRVIYGLSCKLLPYRAEDAAVRLYIAQLKKGRYMRDHYICHLQIQDRRNVKCFIVLTVEHLLFVLMNNRKVIYEIKCEEILAQRPVEKGLEIRTFPSSFKVRCRQKTKGLQVFTLPIYSREMLERLYKKLQKLIRPRES